MHALPSEWRLVEASGRALPLPRTMLFLGRDDCDINIPSRSVDKRHAVLTYDGYEEKFRVKDLSSINGTYVNDERLAEQEYVTLEDMDTLRFGCDPVVYRMERIEELPHLEQQEMAKSMPNPIKVSVSPPRSPPPLVTSQGELPTWAVRQQPGSWHTAELGLAECQGCIAEQGIRHTCGGSEESHIHHHNHHVHNEHPVLQTSSQPDHSCTNGHLGSPLSHNRWKESRSKRHHHHHDAPYQQQAVHTKSSVNHNGTPYRHEHKYHSSTHMHFGGTPVTSSSLCLSNITTTSSSPRDSSESSLSNSRECERRNSDNWTCEFQNSDGKSSGVQSSVGGCSPKTVDPAQNEDSAQPLVDEQELAASQKVNLDGEGNTSTTSAQLVPLTPPPQENFHTHFQIIPPRKGQNYRVINVQFTSPNLAEPNSPGDIASRPNSAASSGYHSLKSPHSHFVFMAPSSREGSVPVDTTMEGRLSTLAHIGLTKGNKTAPPAVQGNSPTHIIASSPTERQIITHSSPPGESDSNVLPHLIHNPVQHQRHVQQQQYLSYHGAASPEVLANMGTGQWVSKDSDISDISDEDSITKVVREVATSASCNGKIAYPNINGSPGNLNSTPPAVNLPLIQPEHRRSFLSTEPELENLQKCTPLYGQPAWWGEQEHAQSECAAPSTAALPDGADNVPDDNAKKANCTERPSSLTLSAGASKQEVVDMNKYKTDPRYATTYMEIPQRDMNPVPSPGLPSPGPAPSNTPPQKGPSCPPPAEKAVGPMAFTVDLGDEMGETPKLNMKKSLSEFLPHKVRRSFRSRSVKSRKKNSDEKEDSPASGNSGKASRDGSPTSRASRGDNASHLYHSDGGHNSALSSDNEDLSIRSDTVTTKTRRHSAASPRSTAASRRPSRDKSAGRTQRCTDLCKQQTSATSTGEATNYLIERMLNQDSSSTTLLSHSQDQARVPDMKISPPVDGPPLQMAPRRAGVVLSARQRQTSLCEPVDNVSESGTYTIEGETQGTELKRARQSIDAVFGVIDRVAEDAKDTPVINNGSATTLDKATMLQDAGNKPEGGDVMEMEKGDASLDVSEVSSRSDLTTNADPEEVDLEPESVVNQEDTPVWVNQWATLATQKTFIKSPTQTMQAIPTLVGYGESSDLHSSSESGAGIRKPRGTGRRLPAVPSVRSSSSAPLSPHSTTAPSSDLCSSTRGSTHSMGAVSETPERDVETRPNPKPTAYIDPRPPEKATDEVDTVHEMLKNSGVTSDVVTFVYDDMVDSMQTQMTDSIASSHMTESMLEEELLHQQGETSCSSLDRTISVSRHEDEEELQELNAHHRQHTLSMARSGAVPNTDVLLKDTADVVRAMAERVQVDNEQQQNKTNEMWNRKSTELFIPLHDGESDSEGSSRCLNGRGEVPKFKPKPFKSHGSDQRKAPPKPFLSREQREKERELTKEHKETSRNTGPPHVSPKSKTSSVKPRTSHPQQTTTSTPKIPKDATFVKPHEYSSGRRSSKQKVTSLDLNSSFGSDLHSESETGSILSTSTDYSESLSPKLGRRGSKGKGPMTMTRPNRAFALRRARLENEPDPPASRSHAGTPKSQTNIHKSHTSTSKSQINTSRSLTNTPRLRPNSAGAYDSSRSRPSSARDISRSEKTDQSLGAKTVYRSNSSRESSVGPQRAKSAGPRTDTGRFTARQIEKKSSLTSCTSKKGPGPPSASRNRSDRISVGNMALSGTRSKSTSRSNSPQTANKARAEEYSAWKRRKTYDPRQAVVDAKAKAKEQKNKLPERSSSAGPHSRNSLFSSVSSEDALYMDELGTCARDRDTISHVSSSVSHQMDAMSRSIESDEAFTDNKLGSSGRHVRLWAGRSPRSAFSAPRSSKSVPLTGLRAPPPPSSRRQSASRLASTGGLSNGTSTKHPERAQKSTAPPPLRLESYDSVMVNSIYQLSLKLRTQTDKLMDKMRKEDQLPGSPSPTDDGHTAAPDTDLSGYKNANQELVGILRNLRSTERHLQMIDRLLFPVKEGVAVSPATSPHNHEQYLRELERIRTEISGFRPIDEPVSAVSSSSRSSWRRTSRESDGTDIDAGDPLASDEYY